MGTGDSGGVEAGSGTGAPPSSSRSAAGLNLKQRRFVAEYLKDYNATQAAIRAGYSPKTAYAQGHRLLKHAEVAPLIGKRQESVIERAELSAEKVLRDIARVAQSAEDSSQFAAALKGHELLGKHLAIFTEKVEHTGDVTFRLVDPFARKADDGG